VHSYVRRALAEGIMAAELDYIASKLGKNSFA